MVVFHGTDIISANRIVLIPGNVDVTLGRGELGQGFYTGENISLAVALAKGRFNNDGVVIEINIENKEFAKLNPLIVKKIYYLGYKLRSVFLSKWARKLFNVDYVCAPFATIKFSYQYKFESKKAQDVLNYKSKMEIL